MNRTTLRRDFHILLICETVNLYFQTFTLVHGRTKASVNNDPIRIFTAYTFLKRDNIITVKNSFYSYQIALVQGDFMSISLSAHFGSALSIKLIKTLQHDHRLIFSHYVAYIVDTLSISKHIIVVFFI